MRYFILILTLILALPLSAGADPGSAIRISLISGEILLRTEGEKEWYPAAVNTPLMEGDSVWCPAGSRGELQLADGSVIRLSDRTSIDLIALDNDFNQFHLSMGHIYVATGTLRDRSIQFDLTDTTVKVYDRARFRVDLDDDGGTDVSVFKGSAYVESSNTSTRVRTGEMLAVDQGRSEIMPLNPPDEWERWNRERNRQYLERRDGTANLPDELVSYQSDLDAWGRWVQVPEYGTVWQPSVVSSPDWAPYREGRWVWRNGDYVWISAEPWGWAPYHYGRWAHTPRGWCWVPPRRGDVFWSPGYVGWIVTPTYVGWVPLAPGEIYYGRGYYGSLSVNITRVSVPARTVVYRNARVGNGVAVVARDTFTSGKPRYVKPRQRIEVLLRERTVPASPSFRPTVREGRMPAVRPVPTSLLPPPAAGRVPVQELRRRHPRLEERRPSPTVTTPPQVGRQPQVPAAAPQAPTPQGQQPRVEQRQRDPGQPPALGQRQRRGEHIRQEQATPQPVTPRPPATVAPPAAGAAPPQAAPAPGVHPPRAGQSQPQRGEQRIKRVWKINPQEPGKQEPVKQEPQEKQQERRERR